MNPVAATGEVVGSAALHLSDIGMAGVCGVMLAGSGPCALAAVVSASVEARGDIAPRLLGAFQREHAKRIEPHFRLGASVVGVGVCRQPLLPAIAGARPVPAIAARSVGCVAGTAHSDWPEVAGERW